jgi:hypothetical protein
MATRKGAGRAVSRGLRSEHARSIILIITGINGATAAISVLVGVGRHAGPRGTGAPGTGALDAEGMGAAGASAAARTRAQRAGLGHRSANHREPPRPRLAIGRTARGLLRAHRRGAAARLRIANMGARKTGGMPRDVDEMRRLGRGRRGCGMMNGAPR